MSKRLLILADRIGGFDDALGALLMRNFLYAVARNEEPPASIMLMNEAVRLACEGSESLEDLRVCADRGVAISACGTCLDYLSLKEQLAVGVVGTMVDAVGSLLGADEVVTIR